MSSALSMLMEDQSFSNPGGQGLGGDASSSSFGMHGQQDSLFSRNEFSAGGGATGASNMVSYR